MEHADLIFNRNLPKKNKSTYLFYKGKIALFHTRRINPKSNEIEVWECRWTNPPDGKPQKEFVRKVTDEVEVQNSLEGYSTVEAICWAPGRTIGNIAVSSKELLGKFEGRSGNNAVLPCQIIPCGKFRIGKKRWYCKTHQVHWGTKADFAACIASETGELKCSSKNLAMNYVVDPTEIIFNDHEEVGIWCSLPEALSSRPIRKRAPRLHVHTRKKGEDQKMLDTDYDALILAYDPQSGLFESEDINKVQVTPPSALEFVLAQEEKRDVGCVSCKKCGYPHLDLGDFAKKPHKKHYCGNCGNDSVISREKIVSNPLKLIHDQFNNANRFIEPNRKLNLDNYDNIDFDIWPSTPAVIWTADREQEKGIHVHVYQNGKRIVDDTFSEVIYQGKKLLRKNLWDAMIANTEGL